MISNIPHPSTYLSEQQIAVIRNHAGRAESLEQLQEPQIALAKEQQWFTMLAPAVYKGLEKALPEVVRLEEAIAWADGSMGWVITLCSGAGWFGGFMNASLAELVFANGDACLAGSGAASGTAEETEQGYLVSGKWWHASGAPHNTIFTANCRLLKSGQPLTDDKGQPLVKAFAFTMAEVNIIPTWQAFGLIASASHAFEVKELHVSTDRLFMIDESAAVTKSPLYQYPFLQLAEVTLAANLSGMALHFIEEATPLVQQKQGEEATLAQRVWEQAQLTLEGSRLLFYEALDASWQQQLVLQQVSESLLQQVSHAARELAMQSRLVVEQLYPYCGLAAATKQAVINRVWRDLHTASQHNLLLYPRK